jgi:hypothetical protein
VVRGCSLIRPLRRVAVGMCVLAGHVGVPAWVTLVCLPAGAGDRFGDLAEVVGRARALRGGY